MRGRKYVPFTSEDNQEIKNSENNDTERSINHKDPNLSCNVNVGDNRVINGSQSPDLFENILTNASTRRATERPTNEKNDADGLIVAYNEFLNTFDSTTLWNMVQSKILSNLSIWDILLSKCNLVEHEQLRKGDGKDNSKCVTRLSNLLRETSSILDELKKLIDTSCSIVDGDDSSFDAQSLKCGPVENKTKSDGIDNDKQVEKRRPEKVLLCGNMNKVLNIISNDESVLHISNKNGGIQKPTSLSVLKIRNNLFINQVFSKYQFRPIHLFQAAQKIRTFTKRNRQNRQKMRRYVTSDKSDTDEFEFQNEKYLKGDDPFEQSAVGPIKHEAFLGNDSSVFMSRSSCVLKDYKNNRYKDDEIIKEEGADLVEDQLPFFQYQYDAEEKDQDALETLCVQTNYIASKVSDVRKASSDNVHKYKRKKLKGGNSENTTKPRSTAHIPVVKDRRRDPKYHFLSPGYHPHFPISKEQYELLIEKKAPYDCSNCYKKFKERRGFEYHLNNRCTGETKKPRLAFKKIVEKETGKKRFICNFPDCPSIAQGKTWVSSQMVYFHWTKAHTDGVRTDNATLGNPTPNANSYVDQIVDGGETEDGSTKTYDCEHCDQKFINKTVLRTHFNYKHKDRSLQFHTCSLCGKVMSSRQVMLRHEKRHRGDKSVQCPHCDYRTYTNHEVSEHIKFRHPEHAAKPFDFKHVCDLCGKRFPKKDKLAEHIKTHSTQPDPRYQCPICSKYLKQDNSYRRHMMNVHGVKHTCDVCHKDFSSVLGLKGHQRDVHGMVIDVL